MDYNTMIRKKDKGLQAIISYKFNGKWKQKSKQGFEDSRKGKSEAKEWIKHTLENLENTIEVDNDYKDITFKEFYDMYIKHLENTLQSNSIQSFESAIIKFSKISDKTLSNISTLDIQNCIDELIRNNYKNATIKTYLSRIKKILNAAKELYSIKIEVDFNKITYKRKENPNKKRALTPDELDDLLKKLKEINLKQYTISVIASKCGLRIGEIMGLTWKDIDFVNNLIDVNKQWKFISKGVYGIGALKSNNSFRKVPMPQIVIDALLEYKSKYPISISGRIISNSRINSLTRHLVTRYKKCGYDISIHELRHTYATNLIANGVDFKTAAKLLGHSVEMTMKIYSHVTDDMFNRAADIINKIS